MEFKEDFLQLVWKYQYFDRNHLCTSSGEEVQVLQVGHHNTGEGPDFHNAVVVIGGVTLHGHVEVHRKASDWKQHAHTADPAYNSVVLHLVWEDDAKVYRNDGTEMPTLVLQGKIYLEVWRNYQNLLDFKSDLPCAHAISTVPEIVRFSAVEKALVERLYHKSLRVLDLLKESRGDWEETAYRLLFGCFGFHSNRQPMEELANLVPYSLLKRHREQPQVLEAMLLGQAGLLPEQTEDAYVVQLKKDYGFYANKYGWENPLSRQHWTFLGARPANFPTLRIVQLAAVLSQAPHLLSTVLEDSFTFASFKQLLAAKPSPYWQHHYCFGKATEKTTSRGLTEQVVALLLINFVLPLWFAYGHHLDQEEWKERCFAVLQTLPAEQNFILRKFAGKAWPASNAYDSQGMIELYHRYCRQQKCLNCKIGQNLLRGSSK